MKNPLKIYLDKELNDQIEDFDLGIVPAGETETFTFWIYNDGTWLLDNLEFNLDHEEVEILESPKTLKGYDSGKLVLKWSPSVTLEEPLRTKINYRANKIVG